MKKILIICGPTATGKTSLAVSLAGKLKGEIISADSRQVYKGLDIGTGKDKKDFGEIPVHLIDVISIKEQFNVFDWLKRVEKIVDDLWKRGKLPIVVGGTGFYIKALVDGIETLMIKPDRKLRSKLEKLSVGELQNKLKDISPKVFKSLNNSDKQNPRRLIRRIEISLTGNSAGKGSRIKADYLLIGLTASRDIIYQRIDQRVKNRLEEGLLKEIKELLAQGFSWSDPGMNTLAYKEFKDYFEGGVSLDKVIEKWKFDEHGYARRQLTWFKKDKRISWFNIGDKGSRGQIEKLVLKWYSEENGPKSSEG